MALLGRLGGAFIVSISACAAVATCSTGEISIPRAKDLPAGTSDVGGTPPASAGPTFHKDVEPILQEHCQKCHATGGLAPFPLLTYEDAKIRSAVVVAETGARRMPPWGAQDTPDCKPRLPWNHDERLDDAAIALLAAWDAAGKPEGDPKDAPPPRPLPILDLAGATDTLVPKTPFVATGDRDQFRCFVLDHPYAQGAYLTGIHVVPGNKKVVHHAVVFTDPGGKEAAKAGPDGSYDCWSNSMMNDGIGQTDGHSSITLDVWTPGITPVDLPSNVAIPLAPNSKLIMLIHYSPAGAIAEPDVTTVRLRTTQRKPEYLLFTNAVGNAPEQLPSGDGLLPGPHDPDGKPVFLIPKNAHDHVETMQFTMPPKQAGAEKQTTWIYGVMAHEHLAGIDAKIDHQRSADTQCLLEDRWDFHWQRMYTYTAAEIEMLPTLEPGDKVRLRCTYDNSMANRRLGPEYKARGLSPMDVHLGEGTLEEMCLLVLQLLVKVR
jgi:hypothetical protein